jgi:hypothetical protein
LDSIGDLLQKKADQLSLSSKVSDLELVQIEIDRLAGEGGEARAKQIRADGTLVILTPDAGLASNLRYAQTNLLSALSNQTSQKIQKIQIMIGTF